MAQKETDLAQSVAAALTGVTLHQALGTPALWWVLAALAACSLADMAVEATHGRLELLRRYLASVIVTLAVSYGLSSAIVIYSPEWREHVWAARLLIAVGVGLGLHMILPKIPNLFTDIWSVLIGVIRKRTGTQ